MNTCPKCKLTLNFPQVRCQWCSHDLVLGTALPVESGSRSATGSATSERVKARMLGAASAIAGRKLDANTYDENDELHFEWLAGWTDARLARMKSPNGEHSNTPTPRA